MAFCHLVRSITSDNDSRTKKLHWRFFKIYKTTFVRVKKIPKKLQHAICVNVGNLARNIQTQLAYAPMALCITVVEILLSNHPSHPIACTSREQWQSCPGSRIDRDCRITAATSWAISCKGAKETPPRKEAKQAGRHRAYPERVKSSHKKSLLHHRVMAKDGSLLWPGNYKKNTLNIGNYTRMLLISVFIAFTITYEVSNLKYWLKIEKIKNSIDIPRARVILTLPEEASLFMRSARGTRLFPLHDFFEQHRHRYHSTYPWTFLTYLCSGR